MRSRCIDTSRTLRIIPYSFTAIHWVSCCGKHFLCFRSVLCCCCWSIDFDVINLTFHELFTWVAEDCRTWRQHTLTPKSKSECLIAMSIFSSVFVSLRHRHRTPHAFYNQQEQHRQSQRCAAWGSVQQHPWRSDQTSFQLGKAWSKPVDWHRHRQTAIELTLTTSHMGSSLLIGLSLLLCVYRHHHRVYVPRMVEWRRESAVIRRPRRWRKEIEYESEDDKKKKKSWRGVRKQKKI